MAKNKSVIRKYRVGEGLTQEELSNKMNVATRTIVSWEQKVTAPSVHQLLKLNDILNVSLDELVEDYQKEEE